MGRHKLKILPLIILAVFAFSAIVMLLWNALIPELFNGPYVSYWQAMGLLVLSKILLHGFGGRRGAHGRRWRHDRYWKQRFAERMASMSPEEREKCRERWKRHPFRDPFTEDDEIDKKTKE